MSKAAGGGMANGPSQSNSHVGRDEPQVWERPWSLEEMRQSSATWSLAADSGLFLFLQDFSQRMLSKTHEMEKQLDGLIRDTKATDACLHTVFNDFLMLSNTQFIENRVYDEEIEDPAPKAEALDKPAEPEKTREQKEAELIPKMQEAVNYGLKVLDSAFEQLDIKAGNSDSEDDDTADRVDAILEPKDLYVDRPLPYLIGSQGFMEQDDVGLGDLSSDEMSIDSDRDSVMESEDEKDEQSEEDFEQEANGSIKKKSSMLSYDDEEDDDGDIFGESDREDDEDNDQKSLCHIQNAGHQATSFADELAARIKGDPACKAEADRTSLTSKKKSKSKKDQKPPKAPAAVEEDSDDMFKPPKMEDDEFSPFGGRGGLFSGGKGLFDDDDEGDLFSDAPKPARSEEKTQTSTHTTEAAKPGKKTSSGGVSVFPENSLFGSKNESEPAQSKENGTAVKPKAVSGVGGGGGLFDDDEEEDDFFTGKKGTKTSNSAGQDRPKAKKTVVDLFGGDEDGDDEDEGDIFSEKSSAPAPAPQSTKVVEEQPQAPQKKMPAGAISMFGPGTKNLLSEGLKKRQPSTSDDSEENGPPPDVEKAPSTQTQKPATRGLFSDDEDSQIFPSIPKSRSQPEPTSQRKTSKAALSLFDDEEEEDLFASAAKSKPSVNQAKATTPQPKKTAPSSLFSDDEDQWLNTKAGAETKTGGMKSSVSAPSGLRSASAPQKVSLFDDADDDDLFAPTKVSSQKKHQRVALLFEDEAADDDDEGKGSLFASKPADSVGAAAAANKSSAAAPPTPAPPSLFDSEPPEEQVSSALQSPEPQLPSTPPGGLPGLGESRKKPPGAVSLFGGIDVLGPKKSLASDQPDSVLSGGDVPPAPATDGRTVPPSPAQKEEKKANKPMSVSLFDQEDEQDEDSEGSTATKPAAKKNTLKAAAETTGVFMDEELLFSRTQQKDNDPDVDLFTTSGKAVSTKAAAPSLFADDDDDDLFTSIKPKAPPKVAEKPSKPKDDAPAKPATPAPEPQKPASAEPEPLKTTSPASVTENEKPAASPVKSKEPSSRIGKLQANLIINPAALLPGAGPRIPGSVGVLPGLATGSSSGVSSSSLTPSPTTPIRTQTEGETGVSFETPVQVATLQSANKSRAKGSVRRRPQSRAARQQAVQGSGEDRQEDTLDEDRLSPMASSPHVHPTLPDSASSTAPAPQPAAPPGRPSVLTLPVSTNPGQKRSSAGSDHKAAPPPPDPDDLFASDGGALFGSKSATPPPQAAAKKPAAQQDRTPRSKKETPTALPSLFDDLNNTDDLFQKVKPRSTAKKAKASPSFLEEDDDDIFGSPAPAVNKEAKSSGGLAKADIFQDEVTSVPKAPKKQAVQSLDGSLFDKKPTAQTLDASLFDDNVDIFADLTSSTKPKDKSKKKIETKSIFDDDMDDIFSVKPVTKAPSKSKKTPTSQDTSAAEDPGNIFDDPLNALGGK